jgi:hypothetical protein
MTSPKVVIQSKKPKKDRDLPTSENINRNMSAAQFQLGANNVPR